MNSTESSLAAGANAAAHPSLKSRVLRAAARSGAGPSRFVSGRRWFPLWGILRHTGRKSGQAYATPIVVWRTAHGFLIPIPFGAQTQWVKNVLAAEGAGLRWRGRELHVNQAEVVDWAAVRGDWPAVLRTVIPVIGITSFMRLNDETPAA
jgi:deazaflavin-dependent oxidoreductase (nitroreductase family)